MLKRFFKRLDFMFAAAAVVGVVVPLAWHAHLKREHHRMLERVGAEATAKFRARQALERDLVRVNLMSDGKLNSDDYHRAVLAVYAKHGVTPPPDLEGLIGEGWRLEGLIGAGWRVEGGGWKGEGEKAPATPHVHERNAP